MRVHESVDVARPPEEVYASLAEPDGRPAGPGWSDLARHDGGYRGRLRAAAGAITVDFDCRFEIVERREGEAVVLRGTGLSPRLAFSFEARLTVRPSPGGSEVEVDAEVLPAGTLAGLGQRRLGEQARRLVAEFVGGRPTANAD